MNALRCKSFNALSIKELYAILRLRQEVFVVEQNCPYLDCDGKDLHGHHLFLLENGKCLATTRLLPVGVSYPQHASIGRVVVHKTVRKSGLGKALMEASILKMRELYPGQPVKISAQQYLEKFYNLLGFKSVGEGYLEDDIPHIAMILED